MILQELEDLYLPFKPKRKTRATKAKEKGLEPLAELILVQEIQDGKFLAADEYVFIVDVSGSMHGFPLDISKELMKNLLSDLRATDKFNVLLFAGSSQALFTNSMSATSENIKKVAV